MATYYNDHDQSAAAWLRELIRAGEIPDGEVDERSILDVQPVDLAGFAQCHFFAGIGGWPLGLRLAGWPDDRPVWTGSPPCQPFSAAGKGLSKDDPRHLAPHFIRLVGACRPSVLLGEQVDGKDVVGPAARGARSGAARSPEWAWFDDLSVRLEAEGYAAGAEVFPSASVGAPHPRHRLYYAAVRLADAECRAAERHGCPMDGASGGMQGEAREQWIRSDAGNGVIAGRLADAHGYRRSAGREIRSVRAEHHVEHGGAVERLGDALGAGLEGQPRHGDNWGQPGRHDADAAGPVAPAGDAGGLADTGRPGQADGFWSTPDWLWCRDGRWRPVEPGTFPLAHGIPGRVALLRGAGNAVNPWQVKAWVEAVERGLAAMADQWGGHASRQMEAAE